jgi:recombination protein RecT
MQRVNPPVQQSQVGKPTDPSRGQKTYAAVQEALRANDNADVRAIRAMFSKDKALADRFLAVVFSLLAHESDILENCTPISIIDSIRQAASLGLEPLTQDGALVRYGTQCRFMPMWQGYLKRIRNSGQVEEVDCQIVYDADEFEYELGTEPWIRHRPVLDGERGNFKFFYAWALMPSGKYLIEVMPDVEIRMIRDQYASPKSMAWKSAYGEMGRKTVIRRLSKRLPASAVAGLLLADADLDRGNAIREVKDDLEGVRRLALRAVGSTMALPAGSEPQEGQDPQPVAPSSPVPQKERVEGL